MVGHTSGPVKSLAKAILNAGGWGPNGTQLFERTFLPGGKREARRWIMGNPPASSTTLISSHFHSAVRGPPFSAVKRRRIQRTSGFQASNGSRLQTYCKSHDPVPQKRHNSPTNSQARFTATNSLDFEDFPRSPHRFKAKRNQLSHKLLGKHPTLMNTRIKVCHPTETNVSTLPPLLPGEHDRASSPTTTHRFHVTCCDRSCFKPDRTSNG